MNEFIKDLRVNDLQNVNVIRDSGGNALMNFVQIKLIFSSEPLKTLARHLLVMNHVLVEVLQVLTAVLEDVTSLRVVEVAGNILQDIQIQDGVKPRVQVLR